jgi:hypothetical protein
MAANIPIIWDGVRSDTCLRTNIKMFPIRASLTSSHLCMSVLSRYDQGDMFLPLDGDGDDIGTLEISQISDSTTHTFTVDSPLQICLESVLLTESPDDRDTIQL